MLLDYIEELRTRSKEERKRFAFVFSSVCTSVVVFVWLSVRWISFDGGGVDSFMGVDIPENQTASLALPEGIFDGANTFFQDTKEDIEKAPLLTASTTESTSTVLEETPSLSPNTFETPTTTGMIQTREE